MRVFRAAGLLAMYAGVGVGLGASFTGCAMVNDLGLRLVSTKVNAYAVVDNQFMTGHLILGPDHTGRLSLGPDAEALNYCTGTLRYSASTEGVIDLRCGISTRVAMQYVLLTETRGYAYSRWAQGPAASLTFGLTPQEAPAYLGLPAGRHWGVSMEDGNLLMLPAQ